MANYYEILVLPQNASSADISRAYRKLSLKWHPDKNQENAKEATEKFRLISEAYQTLIDEGRRRQYDARITSNNDSENFSSSEYESEDEEESGDESFDEDEFSVDSESSDSGNSSKKGILTRCNLQ